MEAISIEEETYYLKSRLAYIRLYLNCIVEFNRQKQAGHPDQTTKIKAIDIICGLGSLLKATVAKTRKRFHKRKLIGERWWWCGCFLQDGSKSVSPLEHRDCFSNPVPKHAIPVTATPP